jgi:hypothetical protein
VARWAMIRPSMIQGTPYWRRRATRMGSECMAGADGVGAVSGVAAIWTPSTTFEVPSFAALFVHVMDRHEEITIGPAHCR